MPEPQRSPSAPAVARVTRALEGGLRAAVEATTRHLDERTQSRPRLLRRLARQPLPYLYEVHPEARRAIPHELGVETIPVAEIAGTAVGPPRARGMDFIPPRAARTPNWRDRWRRVLDAVDKLVVLPPIDVLRHADRYWVLDGHNRVAAALYIGQQEIDANVVDLAPLGSQSDTPRTTPPNVLQEHSEIQAALSRRSIDEPATRQPNGPTDQAVDTPESP
jgi:ParB-like nuclease family protein